MASRLGKRVASLGGLVSLRIGEVVGTHNASVDEMLSLR